MNRIPQTRELGEASYGRGYGDFKVGEEGKGVLGTENSMGKVWSKRRYENVGEPWELMEKGGRGQDTGGLSGQAEMLSCHGDGPASP